MTYGKLKGTIYRKGSNASSSVLFQLLPQEQTPKPFTFHNTLPAIINTLFYLLSSQSHCIHTFIHYAHLHFLI